MPSEVHLTRAQKWDLVRLSAAAVASTVFFTVPMFLAHPREAVSQVEDRHAAPAEVGTSGVSHAVAAPVSPANTPRTSTDENADVSVVTSMEFALATAPLIQSPGAVPRPRSNNPGQLRARANTAAPNSSTSSFGRRMARFFAGSGKYNVRPFPTIATSGS
jgi:hypothetical protein